MSGSVMICGTMSNVGKSWLVAALCRIFKQDGFNPLPFKSQNMALNSYVTRDGCEIGRAQAMQAYAAGAEPDVRMNPILLKPTGDRISQVILNGRPYKNMDAGEYFAFRKSLMPKITEAYDSLKKESDIVVVEGAGSPAEINLKKDDIVNMGLAEAIDAPVLLVGDIDRGGVFAQLYGTVALLEEYERRRIRGIIINKFRGDISLLEPGIKQLEELCNIPVLGVVPYSDISIEEEDSLSRIPVKKNSFSIEIVVVDFPHISNYTDFNPLWQIPEVSVRYVKTPEEIGAVDMVILPGTKNTISDTQWLFKSGLAEAIVYLAGEGLPLLGICGGFQMLGMDIFDPYHIESTESDRIKGLGLLPVDTVIKNNKLTKRVKGNFGKLKGFFSAFDGESFSGYEIHMGESAARADEPGQGFFDEEGHLRGFCSQNVLGTYVHGMFDEGNISLCLVKALAKRSGAVIKSSSADYGAFKEKEYDRLAALVRSSLDIGAIYGLMDFQV